MIVREQRFGAPAVLIGVTVLAPCAAQLEGQLLEVTALTGIWAAITVLLGAGASTLAHRGTVLRPVPAGRGDDVLCGGLGSARRPGTGTSDHVVVFRCAGRRTEHVRSPYDTKP